MPRTRSIAWAELKIGLIGIAALLIVGFFVLAVGGGGGFWWQRYALKTRFDAVQGLKPGAVVRLSGKEVGAVTLVEFSGPQVEVTFEALKTVQPLITTETVAQIGSLSLLGDTIIDLKGGRGGRALAPFEYVKANQSTGAIDELSATASNSLQQMDHLISDIRAGRGTLGKIVTDESLYKDLQALLVSATGVTHSLESGRGTIGSLMKDPAAYAALKASLENLQTMTARINGGQGALGKLLNDEAVARSISGTTTSLDQITGRLSRGEGSAGKLLTDQQLYDRLNSTASRVDQLLAGLDAGRGTAGQLLHDQQLYDNMNRTVVELRDLLAEIRKDPKKYLRVNVSIF